MQRGMQMNV